MRKQLASVVALGFVLAACESKHEQPVVADGNGFPDWPAPSAEVRGPNPGSAEDFKANINDSVYFAFDSYELTTEGRAALDQQIEWLNQWPQAEFVIEGHCDVRGTVEYNLALGERRGNAIKHYLITNGVDPSRLDVVSYGKERPAETGLDEGSHAQNRRGVSVLR